ncbi:4'-phosphopantetheinyl transferase superfamily protein [Labilithrix luteola]|nr:4'-phosphopantetheinyl transferase superfamily protein [Labilithrix luteola]
MQLVGDDVVDLDDLQNVRHHPRFAARITNDEERTLLARSSDPHVLLWTLFAAKEAAFKVAAKLRPAPVFAHARFAVAPDLASVRWDGLELLLRIHRGAGYVHAIATTEPGPIETRVAEIGLGEDPSRAARALLGREVTRAPAPGSWDGFGPPRLRCGLDVSLSHDGRFVSFALPLRTTATTCRAAPPSSRWR